MEGTGAAGGTVIQERRDSSHKGVHDSSAGDQILRNMINCD